MITYEIVSGNENGNFTINQSSGAIETTGPIDRETVDKFILKIRASDSKCGVDNHKLICVEIRTLSLVVDTFGLAF